MPDTSVPAVIPAEAQPAVPLVLASEAPDPKPLPLTAAHAVDSDAPAPAKNTSDAATPADDAVPAPAPIASSEPATVAADGGEAAPQVAAANAAQPAARDMSPAACADLLKQHFPALFSGPPKPIKLRVHADIQQRAPGVFTKGALSAFFRRYTGSTGYLIALGKASQRFDLDGQPAGELTEEHRQLARDELTRRRQVTRERDNQAQAQEQVKTQAEQAQRQAQQAEALQARQARAAMLRDFSRTTLTLANFCALKGLSPDALTPLLDQARKEAAEAPPPPQPRPLDDRRGPHGMRRDGPPGAPRRDARDGHADGPRQPRPAGGPGERPRAGPSGRPTGRPTGRPNSR